MFQRIFESAVLVPGFRASTFVTAQPGAAVLPGKERDSKLRGAEHQLGAAADLSGHWGFDGGEGWCTEGHHVCWFIKPRKISMIF